MGDESQLFLALQAILTAESSRVWDKALVDMVRVALGYDTLYAIDDRGDHRERQNRKYRINHDMKTGGIDGRREVAQGRHVGAWHNRGEKGQL